MARAVNWNNVSMLTPGMKNLGTQFNERFKNRDGASDGAVGDFAHSQGTSGHNPDDTSHDNAEWDRDSDNKSEIRAIDVDDTLNDDDVEMIDVINHMRKLPGLSSVIRYMIYNGRIYRASNGFASEAYGGSNKHTMHAHFSGAYSNASDENDSFDYQFDKLGVVDMPLTTAEIERVAELTADKVWAEVFGTNSTETRFATRDQSARNYLMLSAIYGIDAVKATNALTLIVSAIAEKVDLDPAEIEALRVALDVPTAEENAGAVVNALGGVDTETLANTLRNVLSDEQVDELVAALSE